MSSGQQQRTHERPAGSAPGGDPGEGLDAITGRIDEVISAGDRAIDRALSRDSDTFLRRVRQRGGQ